MNGSEKSLQERIETHIAELERFTATPGRGTTRLTYSPQDLGARAYLKERMREYGLDVREDGFGNLFGKREGTIEGAPSVLIGSHFDSVPNGGAYDGPAGVIAGLEVARLFAENGTRHAYPLEVFALIEEEGARFPGGLMGSRAMLGVLSKEEFARQTDKDGVTTIEAMRAAGLDPSLPGRREQGSIKAYLELHIEQGPLLEDSGIPVGVVDAIVGLAQVQITVKGRAGHAGTTPMNRRSDALVAASRIVAQLPDAAEGEEESTVVTVGRLNVFPNGANVIPDRVVFTVDLRSGAEEHVRSVLAKTKELALAAAGDGIEVEIEDQLYIAPKRMDESVRALLREKSGALGIAHRPISSGAGHDAMIFADFTAAGMLFVPSRDGLSHCPEEWTDAAHIADAVRIFHEAARALTEAE
ncbi:Zn-dependent hydrolase [Saccharibacillus sp. CPCC 101409]|uniref:Zn-dependent hydrolase n=1 Tax=Saccharibacillus sp. CPCC 101409 TaxID=3058041 RepID=UPI0026731B86|nr:Zn-dependent hydrolase [Saccharibacillus sp. CPCC 101409]MDO3409873.1 Zn-dependent hydrolase [Saccharibacillus sp. CPCC 101409]